MGGRLLANSPPINRKLSTSILAIIDHVTLLAGVGQNGPGSGEAETRKSKQTDQSHRRILVIEDDPFSLELYTILLEAVGYTVLPATDGEQGLAMARREQPDLIICDVKLPKLGGCEVVRNLKADPVLRKVPIIAVTALDSRGDSERLLAAGFDGYIAKPIEAKVFVEQIKEFFNQGRDSRIKQ